MLGFAQTDRVEASHNLQALCLCFTGVFLLSSPLQTLLYFINKANNEKPAWRMRSSGKIMLNNPIVPQFHVNHVRPSHRHQLSNSLFHQSTWLSSNLFNLCKMAISAANLFKVVASFSVPFRSVRFSSFLYFSALSRVMKIKTSCGIFICQLGGFKSFAARKR